MAVERVEGGITSSAFGYGSYSVLENADGDYLIESYHGGGNKMYSTHYVHSDLEDHTNGGAALFDEIEITPGNEPGENEG